MVAVIAKVLFVDSVVGTPESRYQEADLFPKPLALAKTPYPW
jgi:hypothetical protein